MPLRSSARWCKNPRVERPMILVAAESGRIPLGQDVNIAVRPSNCSLDAGGLPAFAPVTWFDENQPHPIALSHRIRVTESFGSEETLLQELRRPHDSVTMILTTPLPDGPVAEQK